MKVVVAMDSFKGSMTSLEAGEAVRVGIKRARPDAEVVVRPLADGGEGTVDALIEGLHGVRRDVTVSGPLGEPINTYYGLVEGGQTAVIEMAAAAGLILVEGRKNPLQATTYGVGEMILDALHMGCRKFLLGIGGSATNDGGIGMLQALGYEFLDEDGRPVKGCGENLSKIMTIRDKNVVAELEDCCFQVACDVTNPLCGVNGATYIYGPQKGVTESFKDILDEGMCHYASVAADYVGIDYSDYEGAGAAGGLGFACLSFLNAKLIPGVTMILEAIRLREIIHDADYVVTGEGRLDGQTAMGKAPIGVAKLASGLGIKVLAFAGGVTKDARACNAAGITAFFPIIRAVETLEDAMCTEHAKHNMADCVEQVFRLLS